MVPVKWLMQITDTWVRAWVASVYTRGKNAFKEIFLKMKR